MTPEALARELDSLNHRWVTTLRLLERAREALDAIEAEPENPAKVQAIARAALEDTA
jgi:hypothetical protein